MQHKHFGYFILLSAIFLLRPEIGRAQNCVKTTPYTEAFSGTGGGWIPPSSFFNTGSINNCWDRTPNGYVWVKAPSVTGGSNSNTGPSGDHTSGGNGYLSTDSYPYGFNDTATSLIT